MRKLFLALFLILAITSSGFASKETIDELIAQLEGTSPETIAQETQLGQDVEWAKKEIEAVKKNLLSVTDKITGITWTHVKKGQVSPYVEIYVGERKDAILMRLKAVPGWQFHKVIQTEQLYFNIDGTLHRFDIDSNNVKITSQVRTSREINGLVTKLIYWEEIDIVLTDEIASILWNVPKSDNAYVRFNGRNTSFDFAIPKADKKNMEMIMRYFAARKLELYYEYNNKMLLQ